MSALDLKVAAARAAGSLSRLSGRGATSLPGKVLMRLEPHAIGELAARLPHGSAVISATNGKTTTAAMTAGILERTGATLVHNRAGANMAGGVAATLLQAAGRHATIAGDTGLFEVDEFWLPQLDAELRPRALLLGNLFRDQLDRYGELDTIADRWAQVAATTSARLVLCADDPTIADLGRDRAGVLYYGIEDDGVARAEMQHAADAKHCRRCGAPYVYEAIYFGHLGRYHCPTGDARRPDPQVSARDLVLEGVRASRCTRPTGCARSRCRCRASTTSTTRWGPPPWRWRSAPRSIRWPPGWSTSPPPSAGPRPCASAPPSCRSCWSRTPPARTRCCAR
jgi:UDP-N-acetylmuramyl tripeptide synthase